MNDTVTLIANGVRYDGWSEISVSRGLTRCVSSFDIAVSERWGDNLRRLLPFTPVTIAIGADTVLTGYVDSYVPQLQADAHGVRVAGRSKTEDLTDCTPDIEAGQFTGYTVAAIATSIASLFGIQTVVQTPLASMVIPDATTQRCETAWQFIDRLCVIAGTLATDDPMGRLVLTTAGGAQANGRLVQGQNIQAASATVTSHDRFSDYIVKGQAGLGAVTGAPGAKGAVRTQQVATAHDSGVPRYRPRVYLSRGSVAQDPLQTQADWYMNYAAGKASRAEITVPGWRQPNGQLWTINQIVPVTAPYLTIDQDLLILEVEFKLSLDEGRTTVLTVGPIAGATPKPEFPHSAKHRVRLHKKGRKGKRGSGVNWDGAGT